METENSFMCLSLVEQDGPNMGRISDVDLAWAGALVEDMMRSLNLPSKTVNENVEREMQKVVAIRADDFLKNENISDEAKDIIIAIATSNFLEEHRDKTEERIDKEVSQTKGKRYVWELKQKTDEKKRKAIMAKKLYKKS